MTPSVKFKTVRRSKRIWSKTQGGEEQGQTSKRLGTARSSVEYDTGRQFKTARSKARTSSKTEDGGK